MKDDERAALSNLVRTLCVLAPPGLVLFFGLFSITVDAWKRLTAGGIVLAWSLVIGCWMRRSKQKGLCQPCQSGFITAFIEHAVLLVLASLIMDHGLGLYSYLVACMSYWMVAGIIVARRPLMPTSADIDVLSHAFLALAGIVYFIYLIRCMAAPVL